MFAPLQTCVTQLMNRSLTSWCLIGFDKNFEWGYRSRIKKSQKALLGKIHPWASGAGSQSLSLTDAKLLPARLMAHCVRAKNMPRDEWAENGTYISFFTAQTRRRRRQTDVCCVWCGRAGRRRLNLRGNRGAHQYCSDAPLCSQVGADRCRGLSTAPSESAINDSLGPPPALCVIANANTRRGLLLWRESACTDAQAPLQRPFYI